MDTILASIRRILNEDEVAPAESAPDRGPDRGSDRGSDRTAGGREDVFVLRDSMMVQPEKIEPVLAAPAPIPPVPASASAPPAEPPAATTPQNAASIDAGLVAARTRAATEQSFESLHEALRSQQEAAVPQKTSSTPDLLRGGGPTIEDLVREELRSLLSNWLDVHLPTLVETLVRSEIAKLTRRG